MPSLEESGKSSLTAFAAAAQAGLEVLDLSQSLTFNLYDRVVLPLDGYVFWVKRAPTTVETQFTVEGSLHVTTVNSQDETANIAQNRVIFTAQSEINNLNEVDPETMWIATHPDDGYRIAFSVRSGFYEQAGLWHYQGYALFADNDTQIIDDASKVPSTLIVSNSLPVWLLLSQYTPTNPAYGFANIFKLFPSFLVPDDLDPSVTPYGAVHIPPEATEGINSTNIIGSDQSSYQLATDRVTVTLFGGTNKQAMDFVNCVNQYSVDYGTMGIMNVPVIRDQKRIQSEFAILGMKKTVDFEVSYYQKNIVTVARKLITEATASLILT